MGIDAIGGAGHQRHIVLVRNDRKLLDLMGQDDEDLLDLIGEHLIKHGDGEGITDHELVEVCKKSCRGQSSVGGEYAVSACTADGEGCSLKMTDRNVQLSLAGAVVDRKLNTDLGNADITHDTGTGDVECIPIAADVVIMNEGGIDGKQAAVISMCQLKNIAVIGVVDLCDRLAVGSDGTALGFGIPPVTDGRIEHHGETHQK